MKKLLLVSLLLTLLISPAGAEIISRIAAIVNDDIITTHQLDRAVQAERMASDLGELSPSALQRLQNQLLEKLIEDKLLEQRVRELGLTVHDSDVDDAINDVQRQNNLTREQLIDALNAQGMAFDTYRENLKQELLNYRLISREVNNKVEVSSKEIRKYFREHIDDYRVSPSIHLQRISLNIPANATEEQRAAVYELAESVRRQLTVEQKPYDVVLASLGNAADGDDMGTLEVDILLPVFQEALEGLTTGEVSRPVSATGRLHLFLVVDHNPGDSNLFDNVRGEIEEILRKENTQKRYEEWTRELREQAYIEIML